MRYCPCHPSARRPRVPSPPSSHPRKAPMNLARALARLAFLVAPSLLVASAARAADDPPAETEVVEKRGPVFPPFKKRKAGPEPVPAAEPADEPAAEPAAGPAPDAPAA